MAGQILIQEIVRLNATGAQSSDVLPNAARKEVTDLLDRLELMMVTVGAKALIFSEFFGPVLSWLGCPVLMQVKSRFAARCLAQTPG